MEDKKCCHCDVCVEGGEDLKGIIESIAASLGWSRTSEVHPWAWIHFKVARMTDLLVECSSLFAYETSQGSLPLDESIRRSTLLEDIEAVLTEGPPRC